MDGRILQKIVYTYLAKYNARDPSILVSMLIDDCFEDMVYISVKYTKDYQLSEEVVSDVLLKICHQSKKWIFDTILHSDANFAGMLYVMIKRASITAWKKKKRIPWSQSLTDVFESELPSISVHVDYLDFDFNEYLNKLNPKEKFVVLSYLIEGYSHKEIALSPTIRSDSESRTVLCRAKKKLQKLLVNYKP